ncbi:MAG: sodium:solute symporter [Acidobacteria bacterium]|nr:sodium:solute symporter [Acidobacteriota bacterium]
MVLNWLDYAVIAGYVLALTAFGTYFARFQRSSKDYFLSGHSVPWWAICFTVVATETSTVTFIGVPAAAFTGNMAFLQLPLGYVIGRVLVSVWFLPAYFRGELMTSYQLLESRFGSSVRAAGAAIFLLTRSLADGIRLFTTALVIAVVTGIPVPWTVVLLGTAMIVYTVYGGSAAVIWTDVVQMFVYLAGALIIFFALLYGIDGGWSAVVAAGEAAGKFRVFDFSLNFTSVYTFWAGVVGGVALTLATHGTDQFLVQRLLSAPSARDAGRGLILSGVLVLLQFALFLTIGVMLYAYYQQVPLPTLGRPDEILPTFVINTLPSGVSGFIVAAIVAAALSPSINAMAASTVNDFYLRYVNETADEQTIMRVSYRATLFWGVVQLAVALACQWMDRSVLDAGLSVLSLTAGPVLGAFLVGFATSRVSAHAMLAGMAVGMATLVYIWIATPVAWTWYAFIGATITALTALAFSTVMGRKDRTPA